ncbi:TPA: hypothetical protein ACH3X1_007069 [Trebouxia sp. C0004]
MLRCSACFTRSLCKKCLLPFDALATQPTNDTSCKVISKACFASAAGAATKEGSEAKKEVKKSVLESAISAVKAIVTSRVAVLGVGAAVLLAANVQTGNIVEDYYKGQAGIDACTQSKIVVHTNKQGCLMQMVDRVGAGFCPDPQPAGPHHIPRHTVVEDLDRILMQDQPSKFYYVVTGAHGRGKSTLLREMCLRRGKKGMGYIEVEPHPKDFGKSLGAALDFNFQEHMGMLNQLVGLMGALPVHKEDSPQMTFKRAASALQEAAAEHKKRTGRPFVLIIDAVDRLAEHAPDILETLQDYCKDWAEQTIVSVVLVCSEGLAPHIMHSRDAWSHAYQPGEIRNITNEEAKDYLVNRGIEAEDAEELVKVTDGVFQRLEKCVVMLGRGMSVQQTTDAILQDIETHFVSAGLLDNTPQQKPGLRVVRELIKPPSSKWSQLFGGNANLGRLHITAAEFRELVPEQDMQDKLLNRSSVFAYDGSHLRFESKTSEAYARDVLPGKVSTSLSL